MDNIEYTSSLESNLLLISVCSIRIRSRKWDFFEKPQSRIIAYKVGSRETYFWIEILLPLAYRLKRGMTRNVKDNKGGDRISL